MSATAPSSPGAPITVAIPKGRVAKALGPVFERAGIDVSAIHGDDRKLIRQSSDGTLRFLLLKPDDVPTYVEYGAAELGVCGRDVLLERRYDLYQPLDLGIGKCRMVVALPAGKDVPAAPRVGTKYPAIATEYFTSRGVPAEIITLGGSVELAPITGLSDVIVDLVESGATLAENGLVEREVVCHISSVLVANRSLYKLRHAQVAPLVDRLRRAVEGQ